MSVHSDSVQNKVPAQAFVLAFLLFTTRTLAGILSGILIAWVILEALLLKNILTPYIPVWSRNLSVLIATCAMSWSVFRLAAWYVGRPDLLSPFMDSAAMIMEGILIAYTVLFFRRGQGYSPLLVQSAALWMLLILTGGIREYMAYGSVLGLELPQLPLQSAVFAQPVFGLVAAALPLALLDAPVAIFSDRSAVLGDIAGGNPTVRKVCVGLIRAVYDGSLPVLACLLLCPPLRPGSPSLLLRAAGIVTVLLFHTAVRRRQIYAPCPVSRLPVLLMATGFFYMILTAY